MINTVNLNKGNIDSYSINENTNILKNLPQNIDVFSELKDVSNKVNLDTEKSYYKLLKVIKKYLNTRDSLTPLENNLSKLKNYIDDDKEIFIEWIIANNFRIGFDIDKYGNISFWKIYKNGTITSTISDSANYQNLEIKIIKLLDEVMCLT